MRFHFHRDCIFLSETVMVEAQSPPHDPDRAMHECLLLMGFFFLINQGIFKTKRYKNNGIES